MTGELYERLRMRISFKVHGASAGNDRIHMLSMAKQRLPDE